MSIANSQNQIARKPTLLELPVRLKPSPRGLALAIFLFLLAPVSVSAAETDPLENMNRATHEFNQVVDKLLVKPLTESYLALTPRFLRRGIGNFLGNLNDVTVTVNDLLRLDLPAAGQSLSRVAVNSTVGLGGLVEVAYPAFGLQKTNQDFGLTLAHYGVEQGPYLVLPFIGPSTVRDAFGFGFDSMIDPVNSVEHVATRNSLRGGQVVNYRASVLSFDDLVIGDDYLFYREAYLQRRAAAAGDPVMLGMSFDPEF
jgi:phospholipid-binding lipoprotein MlaA